MSETKWTPGPWEVCDLSIRDGVPVHEITSLHDSCWIAQVQDHRNCSGTLPGSANAHLIAAAPELYEALEALVPFAIGSWHIEPIDGAFEGAMQRVKSARAALRKARGEQS